MAAQNKKVLIVYAHHFEKSLNAAILDSTIKALKANGCEVLLSDLYAQNFNPVMGFHDETDRPSPEGYSYLGSIQAAYNAGKLADEIKSEQSKVTKADLIIFQFPMQWFSVPAILKGWFDRVLAPGFAYDGHTGRMFDKGLLKGKKAILSFTTFSPGTAYTSEGINGDLNVILYPLHRGTLGFCGFEVLSPNKILGANFMGQDGVEQAIKAWTDRIPKLWTESPLPAIPMGEFDMSKGFIMKDDSAFRSSVKAPSAGTHCSKPLA